MEEEKKLYPLRFGTVPAEWPWGTETWHAADLGTVDTAVCGGWLDGDTLSDIMETYIDHMVGENVYYWYGRQFPVAVRTLHVTGRTPLWVCPGDEVAAARFDSLGKAKLWYVTEAGPEARLWLGLERELTARDFYGRCMDGRIAEDLHGVVPKKGDFFFIAPGTVHAACGVDLVEISEASALDIKVFDWGGFLDPEDFGVVDAIDFVDLHAHDWTEPEDGSHGSCDSCGSHGSCGAGGQGTCCHGDGCCHEEEHGCHCHDHHDDGCCHEHHDHHDDGCCHDDACCHHHGEERPEDRLTDVLVDIDPFTVTRIRLTDALHIYTEQFGSFLLYTCVEGAAEIRIQGPGRAETHALAGGESLLIPAETPDFFLVPVDRMTVLLETTVRHSDTPDSYIDPEAEPYLEGEDYSTDEDLDDRIDYELSLRREKGE